MTGDVIRPSAALRTRAVRRVLLALSRFGRQVRRVSVRLAEPPNPLGGVDQRCRMRAWLLANDGVRSEAINGRIESAVDRAALQLARRVGWALNGAPGNGAGTPSASGPVDRPGTLHTTLPAGSRKRVRRRTRSG